MSNELPEQLRVLVDCLREQKESEVSLSDVASVTEVLIASMQSFFKKVDTSIYRECRDMSEYIINAREEIASIGPDNTENSSFPRAGMELDAIVKSTEEATDTIMNSAETIMELMGDDIADNQDKINEAVMEIFEACSFQDITGQRISKVVNALSHIEGRVLELRNLMGVSEEDVAKAQTNTENEKEGVPLGKVLAQGPSLEGEGIDQDEVDAMMAGGDEEADAPEEEVESGNKSVGQDDIDALMAGGDEEEEIKAEDEAESPKSEPEEGEEDKDKGRTTSQNEIDALFN